MYEFFKGYIRLDGKKPLDKFKDAPLRTYEQVKDEPEFGGVMREGYVLIDIDDAEQAEKLFKIVKDEEISCQVHRTTRGMHFFFKDDGTFTKCAGGATLAIGLKADIKTGQAPSYAVVKQNGKVREIINYPFVDEECDPAPVWLRVVHTNIEPAEAEGGEGRNSTLFRYILPLQQSGFSKDEIVETLRIINEYIFEKPLGKSEFETITRDEAFEKACIPSFYEGKKFCFEKFAQYMMTELHVKRVNGALCVYKDGVYVDGYRRIEKMMIDVLPNLSRSQRAEVLEYLEVMVAEETPMAEAHLVAFKNGLLNVYTGQLEPFKPEHVILNRIDWNYRHDARCDLVDNTLWKLACGDANLVALLTEVVGYCFFRRNELRKAFIFTGGARGGKSTFIAMLMKLLGEANTSALDLKELGERFKTAELFGKLANLGDDIGDEFIGDTAVFKKLVSGDRLTAERKGQDPFAFSNYSKMIFSANQLPRVKDRVGAVIDRLIVVPFNAVFSKDDPDYNPYIKYELTKPEAIERLIALGVMGLRRVLENNAFTSCESVERQLSEYNEMNNPIIGYFRELREESGEDALVREPIAHWYQTYCEYCLVNQMNPLSRREFTAQMMREFGLEIKVGKINGKSVRMFRLK